jgi:hypothetical protein
VTSTFSVEVDPLILSHGLPDFPVPRILSKSTGMPHKLVPAVT